ncbi:hypothetical protein [Microlunatus parietis]|uniref:Uncharacterized protein n=1 Tax=Microlunatus parietis TaxID=682979 RepID=A0A7Y9I5B8_9ACTN|nr:hypothetical protein [Microlunatus parietis]NYE70582.1 hypothetical protein [Microlunatus parietis]
MKVAHRALTVVNLYLDFTPFLAGMVVALVARLADRRVRVLVLIGCLLPFVSAIGSRVFLGLDPIRGQGDDVHTLAYGLLDVGELGLHLISGALLLLALTTVLRERRQADAPDG